MNRPKRTTWSTQPAFAVLLVVLVSLCAQPDGMAASGSENWLGLCTKQDIQHSFSSASGAHKQLRILVTRFDGPNDDLRQDGAEIATWLYRNLKPYLKNALDPQQSGMSTNTIYVQYIPCVVINHDHARQLVRSAHAKLIFWGHVFERKRKFNKKQRIPLRLEDINSSNQFTNSNNINFSNYANIIINDNPLPQRQQGGVQVSLTLNGRAKLEADAEQNVPVNRITAMASAELPQMLTESVKQLFECVLGLHALQSGRHKLAARFLESLRKVAAGTKGESALYRALGQSLVTIGEIDTGLSALKHAYSLCKSIEPICQRDAQYRLGWAYDCTGSPES